MAFKVGISILDHQSNATNIEVPVPVWAELGPAQPQLVSGFNPMSQGGCRPPM